MGNASSLANNEDTVPKSSQSAEDGQAALFDVTPLTQALKAVRSVQDLRETVMTGFEPPTQPCRKEPLLCLKSTPLDSACLSQRR